MDIESLSLSNMKSLSSAKVLIVDDNKHNQELFTKFLDIMDISDVLCADDGVSGIEMMTQNDIDLVILDVNMPNMNGEEFLYNIRQVPEFNEIPVIVQTGDENNEAKDKMFKAGATDFVVKPVSPLEFFSRVRVHLENKMLITQLNEEIEKIKNNMMLIKRMQESLNPDDVKINGIKNIYNLDIGYNIEICNRIGGGFWDAIKIDDNNMILMAGEASGYGIATSMNVFRMKTMFDDIAELNENDFSKYIYDINDKLAALLARGQYIAVACLWIDLENKKISCINAGYQSPLIKRGNGDIEALVNKSTPLGMVKNTNYEIEVTEFNEGDIIYLYNSFLINGKNEKGDVLGIDMVKNTIKNTNKLVEFCNQMKSELNDIENNDFVAVAVKKLYDKK